MKTLSNSDIEQFCLSKGLDPIRVKTIWEIESAGSGFYTEGNYKGELLCRFEGHLFRRYTNGKYDKDYPHLSYSNWRLGSRYNRGLNEFGRFFEAFKLDILASYYSTSWGAAQILGINYKVCGYGSAKDMIIDFYERGEIAHLEAFCNYCTGRGIIAAMEYTTGKSKEQEDKELARFFYRYNGSKYIENGYLNKWNRIYQRNKTEQK